MPYTVYVLRSELNNHRYIGQTNNISQRLQEHNNGRVRSTKAYRPYKLIYQEEFVTRREAVEREKYFKTHRGYTALQEILGA